MSCLDPVGNDPQTIYRSRYNELFVTLPVDEVTGDPIDLVDATAIAVKLKADNDDAPVLSLTLAADKVVLTKGQLGQLKALISAEDAALLEISAAAGDRTVQVDYTVGGNVKTAVIADQHTVADPAFT